MAEEKRMTAIEWRRLNGETEIIEERRMTEIEWWRGEEREIEKERMIEMPKFESRKIEAKSYERRILKGGYESVMIERKVVNYFSFERVAKLLIAGELGDIEGYRLPGEDTLQREAEVKAKEGGMAEEMAGDMDWSLRQPPPHVMIPGGTEMHRNWMRAKVDYII